MSSLQPELTPHPHRNQRLFSDHYLDTILPAVGEWQTGAERAEAVRDEIKALYAAFVPSSNEAQSERELIRPILERLGHDFEVQPSLSTGSALLTPQTTSSTRAMPSCWPISRPS
jgi:hypothetical protein